MPKIIHDRENCIGCNACVFDASEFWEMGDDGKVNLKGGVQNSDGKIEREINSSEEVPNKRAAEDCPVGVITIQ